MMIRASAATLFVAVLAWLPEQATFRSSVETVRVDVLVTRDGRPTLGLTATDFEIRDNGVLQTIDQAVFEEISLNVVLTLDGSGSVKGERARLLIEASRDLIDQLKPDDQAALVAFGGDVLMRSGLTHEMRLVRTALDEALPIGETALIDATSAALLTGESQPGRALVVVFSDGVEVSSYLPTESVIDLAKRSDGVVYSVSPKNVRRPPFLRDLADASGGDLLEIQSNSEIDQAFRRILDEFRHRYLLSYRPNGVDRNGWHRLQVRVRKPGVTVKARPGYTR
jgi:Ca-activated chloride channel homolog